VNLEEDREINTPAVKFSSIVTDTKHKGVDLSCFYPSMEITDKERATAQALQHLIKYSALKLVDLKEWKNNGKTSTYTLNSCMGKKPRICYRAGTNFKVMVVGKFALYFFNRHAIYDHSY
jgi:hypothetical protein